MAEGFIHTVWKDGEWQNEVEGGTYSRPLREQGRGAGGWTLTRLGRRDRARHSQPGRHDQRAQLVRQRPGAPPRLARYIGSDIGCGVRSVGCGCFLCLSPSQPLWQGLRRRPRAKGSSRSGTAIRSSYPRRGLRAQPRSAGREARPSRIRRRSTFTKPLTDARWPSRRGQCRERRRYVNGRRCTLARRSPASARSHAAIAPPRSEACQPWPSQAAARFTTSTWNWPFVRVVDTRSHWPRPVPTPRPQTAPSSRQHVDRSTSFASRSGAMASGRASVAVDLTGVARALSEATMPRRGSPRSRAPRRHAPWPRQPPRSPSRP